ncbi:MAG: hypothetical protein B7Y35_09045 [Sphingomonadales bacterium 28-64-96]|nr:MAG: hypothetical protein B7Y35_09045 [Sphingomonadales bacterium 28-64-96]
MTKRNFLTALSTGPFSGDVVGHWRAFFVRLPAGYGALNQRFAMLGWDFGDTGTFGTTQDWVTRIPGGASATAPLRLQVQDNSTAAAWPGSEGVISSIPQFVVGTVYLVATGVCNTGTNASPVWRNFAAVCPVGGSASSQVGATASGASFLTGTTQRIFNQVFVRQGTIRTPQDVAMEEVVYVTGDFPWDTVNNRPHHDALQALAGAGGNPFLTYEGLIAAQNAGSLPYANCRQGKGRAEYRFTLRSLAAGLTNTGATAGILTEQGTPGGLADIASIAPAHWLGGVPSITETGDKFIPGRGAVAWTSRGTYQAGATALERRWESVATGNALPGLDWAPVDVMSAGNWTDTDIVPVGGPYCLRVRDVATPALATASEDWLSGTRVLMHGQSAMALSVRTGFGGTALGPNLVSAQVASGAQGVVMRLNNMYANGGSGGNYAAPSPVYGRLRSGETPAIGHGAILFLNEWNSHNPGHPLMICNMAINTHAMSQWTANDVIPDGDATWRFMGPATPNPPGVANGNDSGVVSFFAFCLGGAGGGFVDAHMLMWSPGMGLDATERAGYRAAIDARFSQSPNAPWLIIPPWRFHRSLPDINAGPSVRSRHVDFVNELGARGWLGPSWQDVVNDGTGSGHPAYNTSLGVPDPGPNGNSDGNQVGQGRLGRSFGWALAWGYDRRIKAHGPRLVGAYFADGTRGAIVLELARACRTLNSAALYAGQFWISTNNGGTFNNTGFTAALSADGRRVTLTSTGAAWPDINVRAEIHWVNPFGPDEMANETSAETTLYGLLYDALTYRGGINLGAGVRPGNVLQGTSRAGAGNGGVPVTARGAAKLVATERFTGSRTVTARLMAADGMTVLREKSLTITAS